MAPYITVRVEQKVGVSDFRQVLRTKGQSFNGRKGSDPDKP